ncbi:MAG: hypothetical protein HW403_1098 [Dehalococcoidia bacterium]|nr:hypothetical protein [Dehalococcoidia bacterium]
MWKVGLTEDSSRATMSHTGSKSPSETLWDSMLRQCGAIKIRNVEEMVDTAKALLYLPPFKGDRVALLGVSGGHASELTETFSQAGFRVPAISTESFDEIDSYATRMGGSFRNPFEGASIRTEESLLRTLGILDKDPNIDFIVMELPGVPNPRDPNFLNNRVASVLKGQAQIKKPIAAVITINNPFVMPNVTELACGMLDKGLVAFWGMPRGAKALYNAYTYNQQREWLYGK